MSRQSSADLAVVVKSASADPLQLVPAIRTQIAAIDPNQPIHSVASMSQVLYDDLASTYILASILDHDRPHRSVSVGGGYLRAGVVLSGQRRREIGVRMALGARPEWVVRMIVGTLETRRHRQRSRTLAAIALSLVFAAAVPEIDPRDPISYSGVLLMIVIVAVIASYIPARRAATINPVDALRAE